VSPARRAVIDTLLPSSADPRLPLGALESGFEDFLDEFEAGASPRLREAFGWALFAAAWVAPLLIRRLPPISRLEPAERTAALQAMERSRLAALRQLMRVLKTVVALHYGGLPAVRQAVSYHA
jgi:hypothetical protein